MTKKVFQNVPHILKYRIERLLHTVILVFFDEVAVFWQPLRVLLQRFKYRDHQFFLGRNQTNNTHFVVYAIKFLRFDEVE